MTTHTRTVPSLIVLATLLLMVAVSAPGCGDDRLMPNSPYPADEAGRGIYYTTYTTAPKTLDPARAYSSDLYDIIGPIYEPPLGYHVFRHPLQQVTPLIPKTAVAMPEPVFQLKRRTVGYAIGGTWRIRPDLREDKNALSDVVLDIGSRSGIEIGEVLELVVHDLTLPDDVDVVGRRKIEVREVDEYSCVCVLIDEPPSADGMSILHVIKNPRGRVEVVRDWSAAEEVELREFINERHRQTERDAALARISSVR